MSRLRRLPVLLAISAFSLVAMTFGPGAQQNAAERLRGTIAVDVAKTGPRIPANLYGIFYEEINHAGDGGLYAELVQNRGFEDANLPPACVLENGFVVPPRTPHFDTGRPSTWRLRWDATNPHPAWRLDATAGSEATIALTADQPLNDASPHSLEIAVSRIATDGRVRVVNDGYWGMAVTGGDDYRLRFFARSEDTFRGPITASIEGEDGTAIVSRAFTERPGARWRLYEATLRPARTDARARLVLQMGSPGRVWLDFVSLFPARTFKNRPNGLRPDLAQAVADLKPGFIRGPGGCFAEGITIESRPQWKRTLGPVETRPGTYSPWGYWSTDGFGYHEFLQFAEDVGADALWVANVGVSCSFRSGTFLPDEEVPALIADTLDAIEYAIGPPSSTWGAARARNGHPAPFPLKYIEIGNEQQGARYGARVARFAQAIKAKYPHIKVVLSSWISGLDRAAITAAGAIDIVDEHAYKPVHWAVENFDSFGKYAREGWDLYIGEFATNAGVGRGNLLAALNDAVYMMSAEKNTDLVKMVSYAPLLENVNHRDWEVNMIHFDSSRQFARATYYAQQLFAGHRPDVNVATTVRLDSVPPRPITGRIGVGTWNTAAEFADIRVERGGRVVYQSDFATGAAGWAPVTGRGQGGRGTWGTVEGAYRQSGEVVAFSYVGDVAWSDVTISLRARKISGAEGFLVLAGTVDGRRVQWNVGGWNNRQSAIQAGDAIIGRPVQGGVETGRWYDLRVEVRDRTVRGYLDGKLLQEETFPRVDTVLAIAGRDERTGDVVLKVVNTSAQAASMAIEVSSTTAPATGEITVLTSANPADENSFEEPGKIKPVTTKLSGVGRTFTYDFAPYSLSIVKLR
ncbi:MAG TPA: alpha-L-arabinofuranosidase C-terminal domain-containing protein [Vicinamibacterales bacterium]